MQISLILVHPLSRAPVSPLTESKVSVSTVHGMEGITEPKDAQVVMCISHTDMASTMNYALDAPGSVEDGPYMASTLAVQHVQFRASTKAQ